MPIHRPDESRKNITKEDLAPMFLMMEEVIANYYLESSEHNVVSLRA